MQPVHRTLDILEVIAQAQSSMSLAEISQTLSLSPSTVHRFMADLEARGFVVRTNKRRYLMGPAVRALLSNTPSHQVREAASPVLRRLVRQHGETAFLAEMSGSTVVCIGFFEGTRSLRHHVQVGTTLPLNAASSARAIMSLLPESDIDDLLSGAEFEQFTARTITSKDVLKSHLESTRTLGYDVCDDEMENFTWAVSAPLFDSEGSIPFAVTIVAPISSMQSADRREDLIESAQQAGNAVSHELGAVLPAQNRAQTA